MTRIQDVMTKRTNAVTPDTTIVDAARRMRDDDIGDVLVVDTKGQLKGIVTDRDLVVRGLAEDLDPREADVGRLCSDDLVTAAPEDDVTAVADRMREAAVRRIPVVEGGQAVGIVSLGDLALERDPDSALADISAEQPNN